MIVMRDDWHHIIKYLHSVSFRISHNNGTLACIGEHNHLIMVTKEKTSCPIHPPSIAVTLDKHLLNKNNVYLGNKKHEWILYLRVVRHLIFVLNSAKAALEHGREKRNSRAKAWLDLTKLIEGVMLNYRCLYFYLLSLYH